MLQKQASVDEWLKWFETSIIQKHVLPLASSNSMMHNIVSHNDSHTDYERQLKLSEAPPLQAFVQRWSFFASHVLAELTVMGAKTIDKFRFDRL